MPQNYNNLLLPKFPKIIAKLPMVLSWFSSHGINIVSKHKLAIVTVCKN